SSFRMRRNVSSSSTSRTRVRGAFTSVPDAVRPYVPLTVADAQPFPFHLHLQLPVLAVPPRVVGDEAQHVLSRQLLQDLVVDGRQVPGAGGPEALPAGHVGDVVQEPARADGVVAPARELPVEGHGEYGHRAGADQAQQLRDAQGP